MCPFPSQSKRVCASKSTAECLSKSIKGAPVRATLRTSAACRPGDSPGCHAHGRLTATPPPEDLPSGLLFALAHGGCQCHVYYESDCCMTTSGPNAQIDTFTEPESDSTFTGTEPVVTMLVVAESFGTITHP